MKKQRLFTTRQWVLMAMLSALAYLIMSLVRIPVVLFLKYEPKDVIITVGGFLMGPLASFLISLVVSLLLVVKSLQCLRRAFHRVVFLLLRKVLSASLMML